MIKVKNISELCANSFGESDRRAADAAAAKFEAKLFFAEFGGGRYWIARRGKSIINPAGELCRLEGDAFVALRFCAVEIPAGVNRRGGVRKGAGRKRASDKRKKYSLLLSDAEKAALDALRGELTPSAFIRQKLGL